MEFKRKYSILYPDFNGIEYKRLSDTVCHDLALDMLCENVSVNRKEFVMIKDIISNMTLSPSVAEYRQKVFCDILKSPGLRKRMVELFDKFEFIRNFGVNHLNSDEKKGIWHLLRRMDELNDYISCVEAMQECLSENDVESEGLKGFKEYVNSLYHEAHFAEMKADIQALKVHSSEIKSVTVGINVNERFEATELGLVSINNKQFKKSGIVSNLADAITSKSKIQNGTEWDGDMHYQPVEDGSEIGKFFNDIIGRSSKMGVATVAGFAGGVSSETMAKIAEGDGTAMSTLYLSNIVNKMLDVLVRKIRDTLKKYSDVVVLNISHIIPEFVYYIRFAEFVEGYISEGYNFCEAKVMESDSSMMDATGFYNLKLAVSGIKSEDIISNNLVFDKEHTAYILTGANRGGKTTITQAIGIMYVLAQGGIFVPATSFSYKPAP